jgi:hypothetical protein
MRLSAISGTFLLLCSRTLSFSAVPLVLVVSRQHTRIRSYHASAASNNSSERVEKKIDNKAMAFLKKIGKVGGEANKDFRYAIGIDEGVGKTQGSNKVREDIRECLIIVRRSIHKSFQTKSSFI